MRVFEGRRTEARVARAVRIFFTIFIGAALLSSVVRLAGGLAGSREFELSDGLDLGLNGLLGLLIAAWWRRWWRRRQPWYVIVTDTAVIYREAGEQKWRVPLSGIRSAEYNSLSRDIDLWSADGSRAASIPDLRSRDYGMIAALCATINERARQSD